MYIYRGVRVAWSARGVVRGVGGAGGVAGAGVRARGSAGCAHEDATTDEHGNFR